MASREELEETLKLLQAVAAKKVEINTLDKEQKENLAAMSRLLKTSQGDLQNISQLRQKEADLLKKQNTAASNARAAELKEHANTADFVIRKLRDRGREYRQQATEVQKVNKETVANQEAALDELNDGYVKGAISAAGGASAAFAGVIGRDVLSGMQKGAEQMKALFSGTPGGVSNAFKEQMQASGEVMQGSGGSGVMDKIMGGLGGIAKIGADEVTRQYQTAKAGIRTTINELDTQFAAYRHNVGVNLPGAFDSFISAMDSGTDMAEKWNNSLEAGSKYKMSEDLYITPSEAANALRTLTKETDFFSSVLGGTLNNTKEMAGFLVNQVSLMKKLGVAETTTAKIFQLGTKAMGKQGTEMVQLQRQIANVAVTLDKDMNATMQDFTKMAPTLIQFGEGMTGIFAKLEVQSKATGLAAGDLLNTAMKFDTFEGAAKAAGRLNAVLGDTVVDTMALIHADPDEKIDMLREAVNSTGQPFEEMSRRQQMVIANTLGMGNDIQKAQQMLSQGNDEAYAHFSETMEGATDAAGIPMEIEAEKLEGLAKSAASADEMLKGASANAANTLNYGTQLLKVSAKGIYNASDLIAGAIDGATDVVGGLTDALGITTEGAAPQAINESGDLIGSPDVVPPDAAAKMSAQQAQQQKAADAQVANNQRVQASQETMSKAIAKTPPAASLKAVMAAMDPKMFKKMATDARTLNKALKPLPKAVNALAKSLQAITEVKFESLPAAFSALSTNMNALPTNEALTPLKANVDTLVSSMGDLSGNADFAKFKESLLSEGISAEDIASLNLRPEDLKDLVKTTPSKGPAGPSAELKSPEEMDRRTSQFLEKFSAGTDEMSKMFLPWKEAAELQPRSPEEAITPVSMMEMIEALGPMEDKTLDTTTYIEKTVELAGKQDEIIENNLALTKKIDDLIKVLGEKGDRDMKDRLDVVLKVGDRDFNAQVVQALRESR